ncbi:hypothetical protein C8R44DRAFT_869068 [Mycena epipterygia]|nr:hypothetical protein C8R44DRAFT_869068 [Mycena epipterygia]
MFFLLLDRNVEAERLKAKERMRRLHAERKAAPELELPETREAGNARRRQELHATHEYREFREYVNKVMSRRICYDTKDPNDVADFRALLESNPCVKDLGDREEYFVEEEYQLRGRYPEWREELADYRDIIVEYTAEELDYMQVQQRARLPSKTIILASGGF